MKINFAQKTASRLIRLGYPSLLKNKFNYRFEKFEGNHKPPYLILANRATQFDPFMISLSFNFPVCFTTNDETLQKSLAKALLPFLPLPDLEKIFTDANQPPVLDLFAQNAAVCVFPEEACGFFGKSTKFIPSICRLIRTCNVPVVFYELCSVYFALPRWSNSDKKGDCRGFVKSVWNPEEFSILSDKEIFDFVRKNICRNEFNTLQELSFKGNNRAEHLETALYVCPKCHSISSLKSAKNELFCMHCAARAEYGENCKLNGDFFKALFSAFLTAVPKSI